MKTGQVALMLIFTLFSVSCSRTTLESYIKTHQSARKSLPHAVQMEKLFGDADHFITHFGGSGPLTWNTEVFFEGRYTLTMQVDVIVDYEAKTIQPVGEEKFYLVEVTSITAGTAPGVWEGRHNGLYKEFSGADWEKIYAADGDFSVVGIQLKKNSPVPNFAEYVATWRNPRLKVSLIK